VTVPKRIGPTTRRTGLRSTRPFPRELAAERGVRGHCSAVIPMDLFEIVLAVLLATVIGTAAYMIWTQIGRLRKAFAEYEWPLKRAEQLEADLRKLEADLRMQKDKNIEAQQRITELDRQRNLYLEIVHSTIGECARQYLMISNGCSCFLNIVFRPLWTLVRADL
jgi:hypothetical protein